MDERQTHCDELTSSMSAKLSAVGCTFGLHMRVGDAVGLEEQSRHPSSSSTRWQSTLSPAEHSRFIGKFWTGHHKIRQSNGENLTIMVTNAFRASDIRTILRTGNTAVLTVVSGRIPMIMVQSHSLKHNVHWGEKQRHISQATTTQLRNSGTISFLTSQCVSLLPPCHFPLALHVHLVGHGHWHVLPLDSFAPWSSQEAHLVVGILMFSSHWNKQCRFIFRLVSAFWKSREHFQSIQTGQPNPTLSSVHKLCNFLCHRGCK